MHTFLCRSKVHQVEQERRGHGTLLFSGLYYEQGIKKTTRYEDSRNVTSVSLEKHLQFLHYQCFHFQNCYYYCYYYSIIKLTNVQVVWNVGSLSYKQQAVRPGNSSMNSAELSLCPRVTGRQSALSQPYTVSNKCLASDPALRLWKFPSCSHLVVLLAIKINCPIYKIGRTLD